MKKLRNRSTHYQNRNVEVQKSKSRKLRAIVKSQKDINNSNETVATEKKTKISLN